jgi:hypothetical protein
MARRIIVKMPRALRSGAARQNGDARHERAEPSQNFHVNPLTALIEFDFIGVTRSLHNRRLSLIRAAMTSMR